MNQDITSSKLQQALSKLNEAIAIIEELVDGIETTKHTVYEITKYESSSGNTTWKADCEDGNRVYFRQAQKAMYQEVGIWEWLNELDWESTTAVKIEIETIPDGDFLKIVNVVSWKDETA